MNPKRLWFALISLAAILATPIAHAYATWNNDMLVTPNQAKALTSGSVTSGNLLVTKFTVEAEIKEEGTVSDTQSKSCEDTIMVPFGCLVIASDPTPTIGCNYCGSGEGRTFTILGIQIGSTYTWGPSCEAVDPCPSC